MNILVTINDIVCQDGRGILMLSSNDYKLYKKHNSKPFGEQDNRTNEMEKQNFKHKTTGVVISASDLAKVMQPEKNLFIRTAEEPTHSIGTDGKSNFLQPIISENEIKPKVKDAAVEEKTPEVAEIEETKVEEPATEETKTDEVPVEEKASSETETTSETKEKE